VQVKCSTGTEVRLAAYGPQAANVVGITDGTDLFFTMMRALGLEDPLPVSPASVGGTKSPLYGPGR
jgi:hypothetical protein